MNKNINVELLKHPTDDDWLLCKQFTLNTVNKHSTKLPSDEWKIKLLESEHSPIRSLWFAFKLEVPYYVSVHLSRHKIGVEHFVSSQRTSRTGIDRTKLPQDTMVSHIIYLNADAFATLSHKRLCAKASIETHRVVKEMVRLAVESNPEFKSILVVNCQYRNGKCTEFDSCGYNEQFILDAK